MANNFILFSAQSKIYIKGSTSPFKPQRRSLKIEIPDSKTITDLSIDSTDSKLAVLYDDKDIKVIHLDDRMSDFNALLSGHSDIVLCVVFNEFDDNELASGSLDKTIILWNLKTRTPNKIFHGHTDAVASLRFMKHRNRLISSSRDRTIKIWTTIKNQSDIEDR